MIVLPIKKKWFDMIRSGVKLEEYREIKKYYMSRFGKAFGYIIDYNYFAKRTELIKDYASKGYTLDKWDELYSDPVEIIFRNGYSKHSPEIICECTLGIGTGKQEWGAEPGKEYFILKIQSVRETRKNG